MLIKKIWIHFMLFFCAFLELKYEVSRANLNADWFSLQSNVNPSYCSVNLFDGSGTVGRILHALLYFILLQIFRVTLLTTAITITVLETKRMEIKEDK